MRKRASKDINENLKVSDIISDNPYILLMLEHFNIGFPLNDKSLKTICEENGFNTALFLTFVNLYQETVYKPKASLSFSDTRTIVDFLKNSHKYYTGDLYPGIFKTIQQMAKSNDHDEMALVPSFFIDYFREVTDHLDYEDKVVFPYVLDLLDQISNNKLTSLETGYSMNEYKKHHNDIEEKLNDLKNLLIKYLPQKNDQIIRRTLLMQLSDLEYDLKIHSMIEELILIPLVTRMESHLNAIK